MSIHHANDREPVERAVNTASSIEMFVIIIIYYLMHCLFPDVLEHLRVRRSGQCGHPAEKSLDPRHPPLQQVHGTSSVSTQ